MREVTRYIKGDIWILLIHILVFPFTTFSRFRTSNQFEYIKWAKLVYGFKNIYVGIENFKNRLYIICTCIQYYVLLLKKKYAELEIWIFWMRRKSKFVNLPVTPYCWIDLGLKGMALRHCQCVHYTIIQSHHLRHCLQYWIRVFSPYTNTCT